MGAPWSSPGPNQRGKHRQHLTPKPSEPQPGNRKQGKPKNDEELKPNLRSVSRFRLNRLNRPNCCGKKAISEGGDTLKHEPVGAKHGQAVPVLLLLQYGCLSSLYYW